MAFINPYSTATFQTNADNKQALLILWKCYVYLLLHFDNQQWHKLC